MNISDAQFMAAAFQIRATEAALSSQLSRLRDTGQWTGPDAERFFTEWETEVRGRMHGAAMKLEALSLVPLL